MHYVGRRASETNPLRSMPFLRPAEQVLGYSPQQVAEWNLAIARRDVPALEQRYASACDGLSSANRMRGPMKRHWQSKSMQSLNSARAQLRAARKDLVVAEAAMLAFAPAVAA